MSIASNFYSHLCQQYPGLKNELREEQISDQLLSPYEVPLTIELNEKIKSTISAFNQLFENETYIKFKSTQREAPFHPGNRGLFMSYDFHVTPNGSLKLIEINTNASFLALGYEFAKMKGRTWNQEFKLEDLKQDVITEMELAGKPNSIKSTQIIDENPEIQKLYAEFLVYRELFKSFGWSCEIRDVQEVKVSDFIYNRSTDFYFSDPQSKVIKEFFESKNTVISPQPFEYFLCADKANFVDWSTENFWSQINFPEYEKQLIRDCLPQTQLFTPETADTIWTQRKNLFFKPKNSYGSKMSYKGASVSKKVFEELLQAGALAQELVTPQELEFGTEKFKYDLRCYAYRGKYYGSVARLYQGQVTNLKTLNGGFATVNLT
ncbi:MAG: hypothetical protein ACK5V3_17165 [Bdellovibrionales bacterium]